ncbi:MAG: hypothetical protein ACK559_14250, partial [bacterium]
VTGAREGLGLGAVGGQAGAQPAVEAAVDEEGRQQSVHIAGGQTLEARGGPRRLRRRPGGGERVNRRHPGRAAGAAEALEPEAHRGPQRQLSGGEQQVLEAEEAVAAGDREVHRRRPQPARVGGRGQRPLGQHRAA